MPQKPAASRNPNGWTISSFTALHRSGAAPLSRPRMVVSVLPHSTSRVRLLRRALPRGLSADWITDGRPGVDSSR